MPSLAHNTPRTTNDQNRYIAVGTNGSWYRHHHVDGKCLTQRSGNLKTEYPRLYKWFEKTKAYGCPTQVMLGPERTFFVRVGSHWHCHFRGQWAKGEDFKMVRKVWLGFGDAYVIERFDGSKTYNLHGYYGNLEKRIHQGIHGCKEIKDLAMNIENPACYAIIMTNTGSDRMPAGQFPDEAWRKYTTKNFAVKW
ncbi:hypothetical protein F4801DRAFT_556163 [Xylaria longipes]|nr:hypothetical protein F4801DRAFT_556163 [Xylaria longipes]